jgi:hypothetical protein
VEVTFVDREDWGFGWKVEETLQRTSHALLADGGVWLVDPVDHPGLEDRIRALGEPAGVIQLLDRHGRDSAALAGRYGVPLHEVPRGDVGPFELVQLVRNRFWREAALWWPERRVLVVADALGTIPYFTAGDEPVGVHPLLRFTPPKALAALDPEHVLVGHGPGVHADATAAVRDAIRTSRRRAPGALLGIVRAGVARRRARRGAGR